MSILQIILEMDPREYSFSYKYGYRYLIRRVKMIFGFYDGEPSGLPFYQYAYPREEFQQILRQAGFETIDTIQYSGYKGIKDEVPILKALFKLPQIGWRIRRFFANFQWAERNMGHMMMFVCSKL